MNKSSTANPTICFNRIIIQAETAKRVLPLQHFCAVEIFNRRYRGTELQKCGNKKTIMLRAKQDRLREYHEDEAAQYLSGKHGKGLLPMTAFPGFSHQNSPRHLLPVRKAAMTVDLLRGEQHIEELLYEMFMDENIPGSFPPDA